MAKKKDKTSSEKLPLNPEVDGTTGDASQQEATKAELPAASVEFVRPRQEINASQQVRQENDSGRPQEHSTPNESNGSRLCEMEGSTPSPSELPSR